MSQHFELKEFLRSDTALEQKIENLPSWEVVEHLAELAEFLEGLREAWKGPIIVTSGFRDTALNGAVGGDNRSAHKEGYAADLVPSRGDMPGFKKRVVEWIKDKKFDQCILEKKGQSEWVHIGLYGPNGRQKCECFELQV